jgi:MSHA biogenesis protein MshL
MPTIAIRLSPLLIVMLLTSCAGFMQAHDQSTINTIKDELTVGAETKPVAPTPVEINDALLPPLKIEIPKTTAKKLEQRFDLVINNAPANQVLMGIVGGTRYSMLVHPDINGNISVNLKDVTVFEALDALRSLYGYEYKVDGSRIFIEQQSMQTRVFQVNYIVGQRRGSSDTRVTSGSISGGQNNQQGANNTGNTSQVTNNIGGSGNNNSRPLTSTSITTSSNNDFWQDLTDSLNGIVGNENGRRIIVNLQSGVIVVRAMPNEIRNVESFLRLMQVSIERQVILEAKIINVQLNDLSQSGVNWSIFGSSGSNTGIVGNINAITQLASSGNGN